MDRVEAGQAGYDSGSWRRIYDSAAWRWVVGPLVYGAAAAAVSVGVFGNDLAEGIAFAIVMVVFVLAFSWWTTRRDSAASG